MSHHNVSIETAQYLASHTLHGRRKAKQTQLQVEQTELLKAVQRRQNKSFQLKQYGAEAREEKRKRLKRQRAEKKQRRLDKLRRLLDV